MPRPTDSSSKKRKESDKDGPLVLRNLSNRAGLGARDLGLRRWCLLAWDQVPVHPSSGLCWVEYNVMKKHKRDWKPGWTLCTDQLGLAPIGVRGESQFTSKDRTAHHIVCTQTRTAL